VYRCFAGLPAREYFLYLPTTRPDSDRVLVLVHGISRNAIEQCLQFQDIAQRSGVALIAPVYAADTYRNYQQVIDGRRGTRADTALIDILDDAAAYAGIQTRQVALFGFSGGAQFAHRFTFLHPDRVNACVCVAAGWYTFPDPRRQFPRGMATHPLAEGFFDAERISSIPMHVMVGADDTERDPALRSDPELDALQGTTRVMRAERWMRALRQWGTHAQSSFEVIPGVGHSFREVAEHGALAERVFRRLGWEGGAGS